MLGGDAAADLRLRSPELDVGVSPLSGGSITAITHSATGLEVLWRTPWAERAPAAEPGRVLDVGEWCACSRGGWQVAFPNAGDACEWAGVRHGFHGEASMAEWAVADVHEGSVLLKLDLASLPISIERLITVSGATVTVRDAATNTSAAPVEVMWTQHPGLGGDLLDGPVTLQTNAAVFQLDDQAAVVGIDARPGQTACWPVLGETDLRHPADHGALLGYLREFDGPPWVDLSRDDGSLGIRLTWDADVYPYCWLWQELGGTQGEPWRGQARVIG
ncbi:MAG: hypothetical protein LBS56_03230, partial [Propionibacteriaceae bacterium]|nr:hypothetical protein [Propionibacteriaceae bacterium]